MSFTAESTSRRWATHRFCCHPVSIGRLSWQSINRVAARPAGISKSADIDRECVCEGATISGHGSRLGKGAITGTHACVLRSHRDRSSRNALRPRFSIRCVLGAEPCGWKVISEGSFMYSNGVRKTLAGDHARPNRSVFLFQTTHTRS